jgi:hypothetical protein
MKLPEVMEMTLLSCFTMVLELSSDSDKFLRGTDNQKILRNMLKILKNTARHCKILQDIAKNSRNPRNTSKHVYQSYHDNMLRPKIIIKWPEHQINQSNRK